ncbi:acyltransferase [Rhizobium leguminosarum]|uniref:acyltransferase family protein n=1 Tax=Rhizobium leguminosarum TaxID=384 RepID=UPI002E109995|nr:acyltransferase [Rhizobium leguminosarum]
MQISSTAVAITPTPRAPLSSSKAAPAVRNGELDFLRGIAILMTFMAHVDEFIRYPDKLAPLFHKSWGLGVDIFFVLSGFLITRSLLNSMRGQASAAVLKQFWVKRIYRIMPASVLWIALSMIAAYSFLPLPPDGMVAMRRSGAAALLNVMNFYFSYCAGIHELNGYCGGMLTLGVWWSLSLEEQFYIVFPLLLMVARPRWTAVIVTAVICIYATQHKTFFNWVTATKLEGICMGVLLGLGFEKMRCITFAEAPRSTKLFVGLASVVLVLLVGNLETKAPQFWMPIYSATMCCCFMVVFLASRQDGVFEFGPISRALERLGAVSFSFYLCHESVIAFTAWAFRHIGYHPNEWFFGAYFFTAFTISLAVATATYLYVEKPFMLKGHLKAQGMQKADGQAPRSVAVHRR